MLNRGGLALHIIPTPLKMIWSILSPRHRTILDKMMPQTLLGIIEAVKPGKIAPTIGRLVPLSQAIPANIELEKAGSPSGKLVVILDRLF